MGNCDCKRKVSVQYGQTARQDLGNTNKKYLVKRRGFPRVVASFGGPPPGVPANHQQRHRVQELGGGYFRGSVRGGQRDKGDVRDDLVQPDRDETRFANLHVQGHALFEIPQSRRGGRSQCG